MNNAKKQNSPINFLIMWGLLMLLYFQFLAPKQQAAPPPAQKTLQEAQAKEAEAKDTHRSLGDRIKSYQAAIDQYEKIKNQEGSKPPGIDARYQELRLLAVMSDLEQNSTAYWDRSEGILKEMEGGADSRRTVALILGSPEFQRR